MAARQYAVYFPEEMTFLGTDPDAMPITPDDDETEAHTIAEAEEYVRTCGQTAFVVLIPKLTKAQK